MNLDQVVDWGTAWTFTDAFKASRDWMTLSYNTSSGAESWSGGGTASVDSKGWPTQLQSWTQNGQVIQQRLATLMYRDIGGNYPTGTYHAQWAGTGSVTFGYDAHVIASGDNVDGTHWATSTSRQRTTASCSRSTACPPSPIRFATCTSGCGLQRPKLHRPDLASRARASLPSTRCSSSACSSSRRCGSWIAEDQRQHRPALVGHAAVGLRDPERCRGPRRVARVHGRAGRRDRRRHVGQHALHGRRQLRQQLRDLRPRQPESEPQGQRRVVQRDLELRRRV